MFITIVFRLGADKRVSCFFYSLSPRDQSRDVTPRLGGGWITMIFDYSNTFCFLLIEIHYGFSISYIVITYYVYYYCIWYGFNTLFFSFFAGFLLFSPKGSVTGCDSSLESFCYSPVYFLSRMHLHFCYYYYDYVVIGVLRSLRLIRNSLLNRLCSVLWG